MTAEAVEGEVVALTVIEPREMLNETATPEGTVSLATRMANSLKDIVEQKKLYATIQGKKFPQVEAWMTIARMDNVVCREVPRGITRHEDGSYEAEVELIRLSDGMVIGYGSALCGSKGDKPWDSRPEPARRSMAVTRATSRAFRQQYSWIMALAGYEPTPAEEMPRDEAPTVERNQRTGLVNGDPTTHEDGLTGTVTRGQPPVDLERRETPEGYIAGFKLVQGRSGIQVLAKGQLAEALHPFLAGLVEQRVTVWGTVELIPWDKDGKKMPPYRRLNLERIATDEWTLPAQAEAPTAPLFPDDDLSDLEF